MKQIGNNLRLIHQDGPNGETWLCQELCPADTWKNRPLWKPVSGPLGKSELRAWLRRYEERSVSA